MSWKVLITARVFATVGKSAHELMTRHGCEVIVPERFGPFRAADLVPKLAGIDATLCSPDQYNADVVALPELKQLKVISRWGVGYDSIDVPAATRQGIVVAYTPGLLNETVADWAFALLLGIARRVADGHNTVMGNQWTNHWGHDVHGKTLGLIGCGRIGQAVARRASGFGMRVLGCDVAPCADATQIQYVDLERLLRESDFVSLHAALTPESRGLINEARLRLMKPSAYLINTARGPMVDEPALARALHEGWIAGAALDVFHTEPLPADSPLRAAPNILLAPHQASLARETGEKVSLAAAQAIIDVMQGRRPRWVVDPGIYQSPALRVSFSA
jgi:glyoxylate reductase